MQAFAPMYQERTTAATRDAAPHWFYIVIAMANEPQPLTVDQLQAIFAYNGRQALTEALQPHVDDGYLTPANGSGYCATDKGRDLVNAFYDAAHEGLSDVSPLPAPDMAQLRDLMQSIVLGAEQLLPTDKSMFYAGRLSDPGHEASLAAQIDQYITDLVYYLHDAHIAAWQPSGLDGIAWEALTYIWRDQAHSAAELADELSRRLLSAEDYSAALDRLAQRNLITLDGDRAELTEAGRRLREEAEARTDELFFAPWQTLSAAEQEQLHDLLQQVRDGLQHAARRRMWPLMDDVARSMQLPEVQARVRPVIDERLHNPAIFVRLRMAREAQPDPYTVNRYLTRVPYANAQRALELMREAAEHGYMEEIDEDQFILTAKGEEVVDAANDAFYGALAGVEVLPDEEMARLNELLNKLVQAALHSDAPSKDCLRQTYDTALERDYAPLAQVDLHIDNLNAFRDDCHISAWAAHYAGGRDWEALTFIWRGEATNAVELAEKLPFRGWDETAYQKSLDTLVDRGWLQVQDGVYTVTPAGDDFRRDVETSTDDLFYASWDDALTPEEENELRTLLIRLKLQLLALAETATREPQGTAV
ncbi:MAG: MarR family winged helix-turn-helix transcriptional regulator [Chloroflexota bacterium]